MNKTPSSGRRISHKPKIGIVVCGFIDNRQFVTNAYIQSVRYSGGIPLILPLIRSDRILKEYLELCDGFLFCGGNDITPLLFGTRTQKWNGKTNITLDLFQIRLMKQLLRTEKPFLSICRGMQVFNVACGGSIYQDLSLRPGEHLDHMQQSFSRDEISHKIMGPPGHTAETIYRKHFVCQQLPSSGSGSDRGWADRQCNRIRRHSGSHRNAVPPVCHRRTVASGKYVPHIPGNAGTVRQFYPARCRIKAAQTDCIALVHGRWLCRV